jgi:hypothetical protein
VSTASATLIVGVHDSVMEVCERTREALSRYAFESRAFGDLN